MAIIDLAETIQPVWSAVVSAKLSAAGAALVTLSDQTAYVYHQGFRLWLLIADQTLPATTFLSTMQGASLGEPTCSAYFKLGADDPVEMAVGFYCCQSACMMVWIIPHFCASSKMRPACMLTISPAK